MRNNGKDGIRTSGTHSSIICPKCGKDAFRCESVGDFKNYCHFTKNGVVRHSVLVEKPEERNERLGICPFCGKKPVANVVPPHSHEIVTFMPDYPGGAFIECVCGVAMSGATLEEAIEKWNRRIEE